MSVIAISDLNVVLFDLDGVLTPTAELHQQAWAALFTDYLEPLPGQAPYQDSDYFDFIDGKPRYEGVADMLASRGIELPYGNPDDCPETDTVCGLGNRKNNYFQRLLQTSGIQAYPGSVAFLLWVLELGLDVAVVSSSKNAQQVLQAAGLAAHFEVVMDGVVAAERNIPGKPAPDTFLAAAEQLGYTRDQAVVVEDAVSGVQAGRAGGFARVIGVDRGTGVAALKEAGADTVVADLIELVQK